MIPSAIALQSLALSAPLQALGELSTFQFGLLVVEFVTVLLGLRIAHVAIRGYRRNDSEPMLFVAIGFVLLVGVPAVFSAVFLTTSVLPEAAFAAITSLGEVFGMASILYGLRA